MVSKKNTHLTEIRENLREGAGFALFTDMLRIKPVNVSLFAELKLEKGSSIGLHSHENESEIYYILEGKGAYNDNGKVISVSAGDVTVCSSGESHALANDGDGDLKFLAIIVIE